MRRLDDLQSRIAAKVPQLVGCFERAAQFSALIEGKATPQRMITAYLLPGGLGGGEVRSASTLFIQDVAETAFVVLAIRVANDPAGAAGVDQATPLVTAVINAVVGWGPDDAPGVFVLGRAELSGSKDGLLLFQIDFTLQDQLRITP